MIDGLAVNWDRVLFGPDKEPKMRMVYVVMGYGCPQRVFVDRKLAFEWAIENDFPGDGHAIALVYVDFDEREKK